MAVGTLQVEVKRASGLSVASSRLQLELLPTASFSSTQATEARGGEAPQWDQQFVFPVAKWASGQLRLSLLDARSGCVLGTSTIPLGMLPVNRPVPKEVPMMLGAKLFLILLASDAGVSSASPRLCPSSSGSAQTSVGHSSDVPPLSVQSTASPAPSATCPSRAMGSAWLELKVTSAKGLEALPPCSVFVRVTFGTWVACTSLLPSHQLVLWNETFTIDVGQHGPLGSIAVVDADHSVCLATGHVDLRDICWDSAQRHMQSVVVVAAGRPVGTVTLLLSTEQGALSGRWLHDWPTTASTASSVLAAHHSLPLQSRPSPYSVAHSTPIFNPPITIPSGRVSTVSSSSSSPSVAVSPALQRCTEERWIPTTAAPPSAPNAPAGCAVPHIAQGLQPALASLPSDGNTPPSCSANKLVESLRHLPLVLPQRLNLPPDISTSLSVGPSTPNISPYPPSSGFPSTALLTQNDAVPKSQRAWLKKLAVAGTTTEEGETSLCPVTPAGPTFHSLHSAPTHRTVLPRTPQPSQLPERGSQPDETRMQPPKIQSPVGSCDRLRLSSCVRQLPPSASTPLPVAMVPTAHTHSLASKPADACSGSSKVSVHVVRPRTHHNPPHSLHSSDCGAAQHAALDLWEVDWDYTPPASARVSPPPPQPPPAASMPVPAVPKEVGSTNGLTPASSTPNGLGSAAGIAPVLATGMPSTEPRDRLRLSRIRTIPAGAPLRGMPPSQSPNEANPMVTATGCPHPNRDGTLMGKHSSDSHPVCGYAPSPPCHQLHTAHHNATTSNTQQVPIQAAVSDEWEVAWDNSVLACLAEHVADPVNAPITPALDVGIPPTVFLSTSSAVGPASHTGAVASAAGEMVGWLQHCLSMLNALRPALVAMAAGLQWAAQTPVHSVAVHFALLYGCHQGWALHLAFAVGLGTVASTDTIHAYCEQLDVRQQRSLRRTVDDTAGLLRGLLTSIANQSFGECPAAVGLLGTIGLLCISGLLPMAVLAASLLLGLLLPIPEANAGDGDCDELFRIRPLLVLSVWCAITGLLDSMAAVSGAALYLTAFQFSEAVRNFPDTSTVAAILTQPLAGSGVPGQAPSTEEN